jgi:carbon dioxide concentrating mechanism protein CcmM
LGQGYGISVEHADERRFRTSSWYTCPSIGAKTETAVLAALTGYLAEYADEYVRLVGVDTKAKRRVAEILVQRPGGAVSLDGGSTSAAPKSVAASNVHSKLPTEVITRIRQLLSQGYQIGTEHADERRFRTSSWYSCTPIPARSESEVLSALEACLNEHQGEYVRMLGIDAKAKRRVYEGLIQRPAQ